jgi:cytidylate kinase
MTSPCVITIDGPSGAGKGTLSFLVARQLGYHLLDSGALYRLVALAAMNQGVALDDEAALAECARQLDVRFDTGSQSVEIWLSGREVTQAIRAEAVSMGASQVAALPRVREALLDRQRAFNMEPGLVADGRDMGTVVFPDAQIKIFLTASPEARAKRRYLQLTAKGETVDMAALIRDIEARDARDSQRAVAPLKPAADALLIDSTDMTIEQVLDRILAEVKNRGH